MKPHTALPHAASPWAHCASPAPRLRRLENDLTTDAIVIGAGITGLNAAWELAQRGVDCVVLEANEVGWGGSGRNGGMAVLRYKTFWAELADRAGDESTRLLHGWIHEGLDILERNVRTLGIDCGFSRCGHITAAHGSRALRRLEADCRWLRSQVNDSTPRMLGSREVAALTGATGYAGGYLDPRAAGIHPLDYCNGFASALVARGIAIHRDSPALEIIVEGGRAVVRTPHARVAGKHVLICTNAYSDLFEVGRALSRRIVPVSAAVVATAPLGAERLAALLPEGHLVTDTRNLVNYFRILPGGRLLFGGRGSLTGREEPHHYDNISHALFRAFPGLAGTAVDFRWSGKVAMTLDHFPHIGAIGERVFYALGYNGRGVTLSNLLGARLAHFALGERPALGAMTEGPFRPISFAGLRIPVLSTVALYYKARDRLAI